MSVGESSRYAKFFFVLFFSHNNISYFGYSLLSWIKLYTEPMSSGSNIHGYLSMMCVPSKWKSGLRAGLVPHAIRIFSAVKGFAYDATPVLTPPSIDPSAFVTFSISKRKPFRKINVFIVTFTIHYQFAKSVGEIQRKRKFNNVFKDCASSCSG